jgi:DNA polymerase I-like protein with 3'-5' exonuclease and polymerase domains
MMAQLIAGKGADWEPSDDERDLAKTIYLGVSYGMQGGGMCRRLKLPTILKQGRYKKYEVAGAEGQRIIDDFNKGVPFVKQMFMKLERVAKRRGYVRTLSGRRCRFPKNEKGEYDFTYRALNRWVQGGSADQMKRAMVDTENAGHKIQLQVHDELDNSVQSIKEAKEIGEIMRNAYTLLLPCKVDTETGPNWGEVV